MPAPDHADQELVRRMTAWAAHEDEARRAPMPHAEVARVLPDLLRLGDALPSDGRKPLSFPPIADGPAAYGTP